MREVILTDEEGNTTGTMEIVAAHTNGGQRHLAFSAYVFNEDNSKILTQQRAATKMLFKLLWANTCCSHPFPEEDAIDAGMRRLQEECGFSCDLIEVKDSAFEYKANDPGGRGTEWEYVMLLVGKISEDTPIKPNPEEIAAMQWRDTRELLKDMEARPDSYAPWFRLGLKKLLQKNDA